ncbi:MAG TPA: hypothetical protein VE170_05900 [Candidatus Limnocylindria bacterium]|nr:hypothetical protein [Candidatus Limnocylindria bacterium]
MTDSTHSSGHHRHGDPEHAHDHDPHDWTSPEYVSKWAQGQDPKEANRAAAFSRLADTIPFEKPPRSIS